MAEIQIIYLNNCRLQMVTFPWPKAKGDGEDLSFLFLSKLHLTFFIDKTSEGAHNLLKGDETSLFITL